MRFISPAALGLTLVKLTDESAHRLECQFGYVKRRHQGLEETPTAASDALGVVKPAMVRKKLMALQKTCVFANGAHASPKVEKVDAGLKNSQKFFCRFLTRTLF